MSPVIFTLVCLLAYSVGLFATARMTKLIHSSRYDELRFMLLAAVNVIGGLLLFGAVAITFGIFNGSFAVRVLDFVLLVGIVIETAGLAYNSFFSYRKKGQFHASRFITGVYNALLFVVAFIYLVLLFK